MQNKSIDAALLALRKQMLRGDGRGLNHVEALLALRGVDLPRVLPPKRPDVAKQGHMRIWLINALRQRPMRLDELVSVVRQFQPDVSPDRIRKRTSNVLWKMRKAGLIVNERRMWKLAP